MDLSTGSGKYACVVTTYEQLEDLSDATRQWLLEAGYNGSVLYAEQEFRTVRFCIVSALGEPPTAESSVLKPTPKGSYLPLMHAISLEQEWKEDKARIERLLNAQEFRSFCSKPEREMARLNALRELEQWRKQPALDLIEQFTNRSVVTTMTDIFKGLFTKRP